MEKYLPFIIGGGVLLLIFVVMRGGGSSVSTPNAISLPPRFSSVSAGPTDNSYDIARMQFDFARTQLTAGLFSTILQRDFAIKQLSLADKARQQELALQEKALELDYQRSLGEQFLNVKSMGGF